MYKRRQAGKDYIEIKNGGKVIFKMVEGKVEKILVAFANASRDVKREFLARYGKNDAHKCPITTENDGGNDKLPPI